MACVSANATAYAALLKLLLRRGQAWDIPAGGTFDRLLVALAHEFDRLHQAACGLLDVPAVEPVPGWSAPDYERLLLTKFGITATVTDGLEPFTCESSCERPLLDERIIYVYVITVDNINDVTPAMRDYLRQYQQSHTHFHIRDRKITAVVDYDELAFDCLSVCTDSLYDRNWHGLTYLCDWSWGFDEICALKGWDAIAAQIRAYTNLRRDDAPH